MSRINTDLCYQILKEYYGEVLAAVGIFLVRNKTSSCGIIAHKSGLTILQVKQAIRSLIQQNIVTFSQSKSGSIEYMASANAILWRLRYPRYIHCAKMLFGDAAELLVEEILLQGQSRLGSAVSKTTSKLNDSLVSIASALPEISPSLVKDKVTTLVKARLLRRCEDIVKDKEGKFAVASGTVIDPELLFSLPTALDFEPVVGSKRPATTNPETSSKRLKLDSGDAADVQVMSDSAGCGASEYWCVNVHQFHHHFRDQAIVAAVARNIDQKASEVMRTMLRLSETRTLPTSPESVPLSLTEIYNALPKDKAMQKTTLEQYLKCLSECCFDFVTKVGESGGGMYQINFFKAIKAICISHIETIILERFGSKALRMFRVLLTDKQVEQKQVEERAMLPPKEAKELLYKMFAENFIALTELSKTPDHAPTRTFYFFNVNLIQLSRMLLEKCYQAEVNVMIRRRKCMSENKRLLDKQERVEAIIASLDADGAIEQKEEVEQMVTPSERAQLKKMAEATKMLELCEIQLDHTIFILETYLSYTLQPPPPKK
ncbi:DNA-directed RNA polymerase III subunit RPC3-like isoform X2 [Physella acuta]|uniref:DNA-directed RNA polymerase III subunit RPC3-like isoform X2 n=1 Tax=Physella acuta TaxID=109671 RepID=UPI0027DE23E6|nr:DNA-directed RNA polymerase III subunit RPC3-like isoform X2 [Physella acuta]